MILGTLAGLATLLMVSDVATVGYSPLVVVIGLATAVGVE